MYQELKAVTQHYIKYIYDTTLNIKLRKLETPTKSKSAQPAALRGSIRTHMWCFELNANMVELNASIGLLTQLHISSVLCCLAGLMLRMATVILKK